MKRPLFTFTEVWVLKKKMNPMSSREINKLY